MFHGNFSNTLDEKGRVAIPARFREVLSSAGDDRLMVTTFEVVGQQCLEAYAPRAWEGLVENLQNSPGAFSETRLLFESVYVGSVQVCPLDRQGRILLPQSLRKQTDFESEVSFVGVGQKFRIFSAAGYEKVLDTFRTVLREKPDRFNDLGV